MEDGRRQPLHVAPFVGPQRLFRVIILPALDSETGAGQAGGPDAG